MQKKEMDAVVFSETGKYDIVKKEIPQIKKDNEVLIKILGASICGTDVHILGNPPGIAAKEGIVLGHECVGEVAAIGKGVTGYEIGDHLILDNNIPCQTCGPCQKGMSNLCTNMSSMGVHIDGVFSTYAVVPDYLTVKIAKDIPLEEAIFAEPLNCVMGAIKKLKIMPGDKAVVLGAGPIGLYFVKMLKYCGAGTVIVSEVSEFRQKYARKNGADLIINPAEEDLEDKVKAATGGIGADIVIDAVGTLLPDALKAVCSGGSVLLFGMNASARQEICQNDITARGVTVYGNYIGMNTLRNVGNLLESGTVSFQDMITHKLPLTEFGTGLEAMRKGEAIEVVLIPE